MGLAILIAALCIAGSTVVDNPVGKMILFTLAGFGIYGAQPCFWALPTTFLSGAAAAAGIAAVNSLGNLSGFFGPYVMGRIKDATGSYAIGLLAIATILGFAMLVACHSPTTGSSRRSRPMPGSGKVAGSRKSTGPPDEWVPGVN